jgi:hypothetical protein
MVSSSPSPPPGLQPQQQIDLIDLTGVMVTTIELVIGILNWKLNLLRKVTLSEQQSGDWGHPSNLLEMTFS